LTNLRMGKWREEYAPPARYPTPDGDVKLWEGTISRYLKQMLEDIRLNGSAELITIKADKVG
jgi:hypothetical protein